MYHLISVCMCVCLCERVFLTWDLLQQFMVYGVDNSNTVQLWNQDRVLLKGVRDGVFTQSYDQQVAIPHDHH